MVSKRHLSIAIRVFSLIIPAKISQSVPRPSGRSYAGYACRLQMFQHIVGRKKRQRIYFFPGIFHRIILMQDIFQTFKRDVRQRNARQFGHFQHVFLPKRTECQVTACHKMGTDAGKESLRILEPLNSGTGYDHSQSGRKIQSLGIARQKGRIFPTKIRHPCIHLGAYIV